MKPSPAWVLMAALGPAWAQTPAPVTIPGANVPLADTQVIQGVAPGSRKEEIKFLPGVRTSLTYTSNIDRAAGGNSGWIAEASPYLDAAIDTERSKAQLYASLRGFFRTSSGNSLAPELRSTGRTALLGDWLWISGTANIYSLISNPFGAVSLDPAVYNTNTIQYRQFQINPYVQGRIGTFADYNVGYNLGTSSSNGNVVLARLDQRFSGSLKSGPQFNRWGWEWTGDVQRREFDGGTVQNRTSASGSLFMLPQPDLRVGASFNYDRIDNFFINGRNSGTGLGAFADWTPSNRTSVSASVKRLYYGTTGRLSATHRFGLFTGAVSWDKSVLTSSDGSILSVNPGSLFSAGGFSSSLNPLFNQLVSQNLLQTYGSAIGGGLLSDFLVLSNNLTVSLAYVSPRNSIVLTGTRSRRETDASRSVATFGSQLGGISSPSLVTPVNLSAYNTTNLGLDWSHTLDSKSTLGLKLSRLILDSVAVTGNGNSAINLVQSSYRTQLTTDTAASFGLRHTRQRGSGLSISYDETAVFGTLDMRF